MLEHEWVPIAGPYLTRKEAETDMVHVLCEQG